MKYCKKCKHIHNDTDTNCSNCKRDLFEITDETTPVYILSASGFELQRVKTALEDNGIPCDAVAQKKNISANAVTGYDGSEYDLLVPFSAYEQAYDICIGIGAIKTDDEEILDEYSDEKSPKSVEEQFEEMSGAKRTTVRVVSAILFIILAAGVIFGVDFIMNFIKGLF